VYPAEEENIKILQQTITDMNADFGEKRAKFRTLFLQKEGMRIIFYLKSCHPFDAPHWTTGVIETIVCCH